MTNWNVQWKTVCTMQISAAAELDPGRRTRSQGCRGYCCASFEENKAGLLKISLKPRKPVWR